jgi:hypothetical protein
MPSGSGAQACAHAGAGEKNSRVSKAVDKRISVVRVGPTRLMVFASDFVEIASVKSAR